VRRLVLLLTLSLCSPAALAASDAEVARARQLSSEGADLFRDGKYAQALEKFERANRIVPHPNLDVNIGRCHEALGRFDEALLHCKIALNAATTPAPTRLAARSCVDRVEAKLKRPELEVRSRPPGAKVIVDGQEVGRTPWRGEVEPGRRQVDLEMADLAPATRTVNAMRGQEHLIEVVLTPANVGGLLSVYSDPPGAEVSLDGETVGSTPLESFQVDARTYVLEVRKPGFAPQVSTVSVEDGQHLERRLPLVLVGPAPGAASDRPMWPGWTMVGAGVVAAGVGGWFGAKAVDSRDAADKIARTSGDPADRPRYDDLVREMDTRRTLSDVLWGSGGVLVVGGVTWLLWPD
jgi:hypothetical protein